MNCNAKNFNEEQTRGGERDTEIERVSESHSEGARYREKVRETGNEREREGVRELERERERKRKRER